MRIGLIRNAQSPGSMHRRGPIRLLVLLALALAACGGNGSADPTADVGSEAGPQSSQPSDEGTSGDLDLETIATLTVDGVSYTFVGIKGGSVLNDDSYCFVGTTGALIADLALEGDTETELRFNLVPDEGDPSNWEANLTAVIPADFDHNLLDDNNAIDVQDSNVDGSSYTVSATLPLVEVASGVEHEGVLEASC